MPLSPVERMIDAACGYTPAPPRQPRTTPVSHKPPQNGVDECCYVCGKPVGIITRMVHIVNGGADVLRPDDEQHYRSDEGDMLWFSIGTTCAKRLGLQWSIKLEQPIT